MCLLKELSKRGMIRKLKIHGEDPFPREIIERYPLDTRDVVAVALRDKLSAPPFNSVEYVQKLLGWIFGILLEELRAKEKFLYPYDEPRFFLELSWYRLKGGLSQLKSATGKVGNATGRDESRRHKNSIVLD